MTSAGLVLFLLSLCNARATHLETTVSKSMEDIDPSERHIRPDERTRTLLRRDALHHVIDVNFSYITISNALKASLKNTTEANKEDGLRLFLEYDKHPKRKDVLDNVELIYLQFSNREPSSKLTGEHAGKLLVMIYPWDGNAHPGNEFWYGTLNSTGDTACASSTQVTELHNAHINPRVSSQHTRLATISTSIPLVDTLTNYCKETIK